MTHNFRTPKRMVGLLLTCLLPLLAQAQSALQATIDSLLTDSTWQTAQVGICIYDISADSMLYAYNAHQRMRPASTEKVVTAIAALDNLGPNHLLRTTCCTTGSVTDGVLTSDLWLAGGMDPTFAATQLQRLARQLRAQGIDSIAGRLRFDLSMKDTLQWGWGWCWDDDNHTLTPLLYDRKPLAPAQVAAALQKAGIRLAPAALAATMRAEAMPPAARQRNPLAETTTLLTEVLMPMMKESDNLYAESVFYQLAARTGRPWAGRKQAISLIHNTMKRAGISPEAYNVADGSGLSLYNYQTPATLTRLLTYAARGSAIYPALSQSLPIAAVDGTLKTRMTDTPAAGNVRAKTGTVTGVTSLAGYATRPDGHLVAFTIIVNGLQKGAPGRTLQDNICVAICK
ncbi:MAG: D-alanyl-D-alanine carboxypeptidase/D-alanyl-D-alanine-endopeptidase [Bacteroidaceae bacterium]|nr:D-alanyl-D-alanine carboxypeptidase/D-alanyl-D-alanine-endopeptidase [Bacteroidaceae bacterium]